MSDLLKKTQEICRLYDIKPQSSRGQNFLISTDVYKKIVNSAELKNSDVVLEIGPGLGFLTVELLKLANKVVAVELDESIVNILSIAVDAQGLENLEIIEKNVLDYDANLLPSNYKIVANLPYNISSVFLRKFLTAENKPKTMTLMLQKEVVERIMAKEGNHSLLSLSVQYYSQPYYIDRVNKENFWPQPKVDSAILHLEVLDDKSLGLNTEEQKLFFRLLKFGFSAKRKKLTNNLAGALRVESDFIIKALEKNNIKSNVRAQDLSLQDWKNLFAGLRSVMV